MKKLIIILFLLLIFPFSCFGATNSYKAKVLEITETKEYVRDNDTKQIQQNAVVEIEDGDLKGQQVATQGISDFDVVRSLTVKVGDKVMVSSYVDPDGNNTYVIVDYIRTGYIFILALVFAFLIIFIGKSKGVKSIISLTLTFLVIMEWIVPEILSGHNPLFVSIVGSFIILVLIVYITWGFTAKATLALVAIGVSLIFTGVLSVLFTNLTKLQGLADDNILFLIGMDGVNINFSGLLLAGIVIGTLGVLDDVAISQISIVEQLHLNNKNLKKTSLYKSALNVGVDHISSMANTLFLAYAGASLPLLLLFVTGQGSFVTYFQAINSEIIATEIVRTLTGTIGLIMAVPLSTIIAVYWYSRKSKKQINEK